MELLINLQHIYLFVYVFIYVYNYKLINKLFIY